MYVVGYVGWAVWVMLVMMWEVEVVSGEVLGNIHGVRVAVVAAVFCITLVLFLSASFSKFCSPFFLVVVCSSLSCLLSFPCSSHLSHPLVTSLLDVLFCSLFISGGFS